MTRSPACARRRPTRWALVITATMTATLALPGAAFGADGPRSTAGPSPLAVESRLAGTLPIRGLDLDAATIPVLQARIAAGRLTSAQLVGAYQARIDALDADLGAVLARNPDAAAEAAASDAYRAEHGPRSALEGIPVLLKDNVDTRDLPTTAGSRALLGNEPGDATITSRLRAAGAIIIGKANLSEWANFRGYGSTSGWSGVGGQTANPYVLDRNPCGSSAGSAAGVAASLAQVSIGTETNGSIVCPSAANGVVGVKPTLGLVPRTGIVPISADQDTAGPIARHAVDAALLLQVISGVDPLDAATEEIPADVRQQIAGSPTDLVGALGRASLKHQRLGVWTLSPEEAAAVGPDTVAVYAAAQAAARKAGATLVPVALPDQDEIGNDSFTALLSEFDRDLGAYLAASPGDHPEDLQGVVDLDASDPVELAYFGQELFVDAIAAPPADDPAIVAARENARTLARASIDDTLAQGPGAADDLDAIMALTNSPAWKTRYLSVDGEADRFAYASSTPAAVAGYPNVTVPAGFAGPQGALPVGVSFIGGRWQDAKTIGLAGAFETAARARRAPGYLPTVGDPQPAAPAQQRSRPVAPQGGAGGALTPGASGWRSTL